MTYKINLSNPNIRKAYELAFSKENNFKEKLYILGLKADEKTPTIKKSPRVQDLLGTINTFKFTTNSNYYVSANTFVSECPRRRDDSVFGLKNIVIDIDFHGVLDFDEKIDQFEKIIYEYWNKNNLPLWNILHRTGRGVQLWWCIFECSKKLRFLYDNVKKGIIKEINQCMSEYPLTLDSEQVDRSASERLSGLFRLFGSYNTKTKNFSDVHIAKNDKYDLNELKTFFVQEVTHKSKKEHITNIKQNLSKNINLHGFRMQVIENLIKNRDLPKGNELRDLHIFHYYNEAVQLYDDITIAIDKTKEINKLFKKPLTDNYLRNLFRCVDRKTNRKGTPGCYIYTNEKIIENLSISPEFQIKYNFFPAGTGQGNKNYSRNIRRKENQEIIKGEILTLKKLGLNYSQIGRKVGLCSRTIKKIIEKSKTN